MHGNSLFWTIVVFNKTDGDGTYNEKALMKLMKRPSSSDISPNMKNVIEKCEKEGIQLIIIQYNNKIFEKVFFFLIFNRWSRSLWESGQVH